MPKAPRFFAVALFALTASHSARSMGPETVEGIAEDLGKYIAAGEFCAMHNIAEANEAVGLVKKLDKEATLRGFGRGVLIVEGARSLGKARVCDGARAKRSKFDADIRAMLPGLRAAEAMTRPATATPGDRLDPKSSGAQFIAAQGPEQMRWVASLVAATARGGTASKRRQAEEIIVKCLRDMLTVANAGEAPAVEQYKRMELAAISAMCALPILKLTGLD